MKMLSTWSVMGQWEFKTSNTFIALFTLNKVVYGVSYQLNVYQLIWLYIVNLTVLMNFPVCVDIDNGTYIMWTVQYNW